MFPLLRKSFLFLPSVCSLSSSQVSTLRTLLIRFQVCEFWSSSFSRHPQPPCKQLEEENVKVSVWWNFDKCRVPSDYSVWKIAPSILRTVRANGVKGPIDIRAYGDVYQFSIFQRMALFLTGIHLRHFNDGDIDGKLREGILWWHGDNPPPIHLFVICSEEDLGVMKLLQLLRMRNYNILVACPTAYDVPMATTVATILWQWSSILKGEDLVGKHFNYPPDGPFDSWYGDLNVPLENPFLPVEEPTVEEPTSSQNMKLT